MNKIMYILDWRGFRRVIKRNERRWTNSHSKEHLQKVYTKH